MERTIYSQFAFEKVKDCEDTLRHAVTVFRTCETEKERRGKKKAAINLAEKLLLARVKLLKAKIYESESVFEERESATHRQLESLRDKLSETQRGGMGAILVEFKLNDRKGLGD